jgi:hypothetical protein
MRRASSLLVLLLLAGCNSGDTPNPPGPDGTKPGDGPRPGAEHRLSDLPRFEPLPPGELGFGGCQQVGNHVQLAVNGVIQFTIDATEVKTESGSAGVIGFSGTAPDGYRFWLGRDGDPGAGAFDHAGSYSAAQAPYHMRLQRWPTSAGATCTGSSCETYWGLNGQWTINTPKSPTDGRMNISAITNVQGCWVEQPSGPPNLKSCPLVGNTLYGCFKVN